ncbi:MAG: hypothetical protein A2846_01010 [Candidatus Doudnabacteria bacterium RIFCSPHIGHO2_01_FULL_49_9]|uniref:Uncharacterized protein n=1 Tax=Candidatus Doudnabacteria bacterium RIFCSPHIGHO2_01_FULL_49_9 TaxID=1817827 RepID=A0A1F5P3F2_9BACT|nr:MAG: hypothetical protein A2846_01010 [Candidatus Doudnabacteria bacterium RIFCSPHIGHO2_01_FULL_49_9]
MDINLLQEPIPSEQTPSKVKLLPKLLLVLGLVSILAIGWYFVAAKLGLSNPPISKTPQVITSADVCSDKVDYSAYEKGLIRLWFTTEMHTTQKIMDFLSRNNFQLAAGEEISWDLSFLGNDLRVTPNVIERPTLDEFIEIMEKIKRAPFITSNSVDESMDSFPSLKQQGYQAYYEQTYRLRMGSNTTPLVFVVTFSNETVDEFIESLAAYEPRLTVVPKELDHGSYPPEHFQIDKNGFFRDPENPQQAISRNFFRTENQIRVIYKSKSEIESLSQMLKSEPPYLNYISVLDNEFLLEFQRIVPYNPVVYIPAKYPLLKVKIVPAHDDLRAEAIIFVPENQEEQFIQQIITNMNKFDGLSFATKVWSNQIPENIRHCGKVDEKNQMITGEVSIGLSNHPDPDSRVREIAKETGGQIIGSTPGLDFYQMYYDSISNVDSTLRMVEAIEKIEPDALVVPSLLVEPF